MWTWNADPFGTDAANPNPAGAGTFAYNLRFPGQLFDGQAGLHQNEYRDYDPAMGRYTESDPEGLTGGLNTYSYVMDTPIMDMDPDGLEAISHLYLHSPAPEPRYFVQPNAKSYLCDLINGCNGDPKCVYKATKALRDSNKPSSWYVPTIRQAENWAYAMAYPGLIQTSTPAILYWQFHKIGGDRNKTSPFSWEALWAGLDGNSHQYDTPEDLKSWCKDGCKQK